MTDYFVERCSNCNSEVKYRENDRYIKCESCGETLVIAEFENELARIRHITEEAEKNRRELEDARKAQKEEQEKVWQVISRMDHFQGSLQEQESALNQLLSGQQIREDRQQAVIDLLHALKADQQKGEETTEGILNRIFSEQKTTQKKLEALQDVTAQMTQMGTNVQTAIQNISAWLHTDSLEQRQEFRELLQRWFETRQQQDQVQLENINHLSSSLITGEKKMQQMILDLEEKVLRSQESIKSFESKWEQAKLEEMQEEYHQAKNAQKNRLFNEARAHYNRVLAKGGKDPEVYWRIILCLYGIEYQKTNEGKKIPSILRPDLTMRIPAERTDLENSCRTETDRKHYKTLLQEIDDILDKYRQFRQAAQYDIFISVKQKEHINGSERLTEDCKIGSDLYIHLTKMGLRVFNSEQQDCKMPGDEWEPYILSALLSSKMMIVVGTSKDHMNSQWVRNEWERFQWLQRDEKEKAGKTGRVLLCYFSHMEGADLPENLAPIQSIKNEGGAYELLDKAVRRTFPERFTQEKSQAMPGPKPMQPEKKDPDIETIRSRMEQWVIFEQFDLVQEEYNRILREGRYALDAWINLFNICAIHKISGIDELKASEIDLSQEKSIKIILKNSKDPDEVKMLQNLLDANRQSRQKKTQSIRETVSPGNTVPPAEIQGTHVQGNPVKPESGKPGEGSSASTIRKNPTKPEPQKNKNLNAPTPKSRNDILPLIAVLEKAAEKAEKKRNAPPPAAPADNYETVFCHHCGNAFSRPCSYKYVKCTFCGTVNRFNDTVKTPDEAEKARIRLLKMLGKTSDR